MTSEEIIQRLLSEQKITVQEAMVLLKDITKTTNVGWPYIEPWPNYPTYPNMPIVYCDPQTVPTFYATTTTTTNDKA